MPLSSPTRGLGPNDIRVAAVTAAELYFGAAHSSQPTENFRSVEKFLSEVAILPFDLRAAREFGQAKQDLSARGSLIGPMDLLIAATALAHDATLLTNNLREFSRVPGLRVESD